MAGQIVMEGFLNFRMRPWLRRLITRMVAVVPAALTILYTGEHGAYRLLILSQVILSMQVPFAVNPLIQFTGDRTLMFNFAAGPGNSADILGFTNGQSQSPTPATDGGSGVTTLTAEATVSNVNKTDMTKNFALTIRVSS
jgi:Mn2+/Fe2+ NRAMP family transporter